VVAHPLSRRRLPVLRPPHPCGRANRPAGCASSRHAQLKNPPRPSTCEPRTVMASSCSFAKHGLAAAPHPPAQARAARKRRAVERVSGHSSGDSFPCSRSSSTRPWCANEALSADSGPDLSLPAGVVRDHAASARVVQSAEPTTSSVPCASAGSSRDTSRGEDPRHRTCSSCRAMTGNINSTLDVLGLPACSSTTGPHTWSGYFAGKTARLPEPMRAQLETWLEVMVNGSHPGPPAALPGPSDRPHPILGITPVLQAWADAGPPVPGRDHPRTGPCRRCPQAGHDATWAEYGLRSLFKVLQGPQDDSSPTPPAACRSLPSTPPSPCPLTPEAIRQALNSPDSAIALAVALVAFHAVTAQQLSRLRAHRHRRRTPLPRGARHPPRGPVRVRLTAWLDHRARTWPGTINPHLFVTRKSAPRLTPVGKQFPWRSTDLRPQALRGRPDTPSKIHVTGGDVRRICDLLRALHRGAMR